MVLCHTEEVLAGEMSQWTKLPAAWTCIFNLALRAHLLNASTAQRPKPHSPLKGTEPEKPVNTGKASKTKQDPSGCPTGLDRDLRVLLAQDPTPALQD